MDDVSRKQFAKISKLDVLLYFLNRFSKIIEIEWMNELKWKSIQRKCTSLKKKNVRSLILKAGNDMAKI